MNFGTFFWIPIIVGISLVLAAPAGAEKNRELTAVQSKIQQIGADLKTLAAEKANQLEQLKKLEKQYGELANALLAIKAQIRQQEDNLAIVRNKITATQKNIQLQRRSLEGLIKSVYAIGVQQGLQVILNQHDPSLSGRMLIYHDYIGKARLQKLLAIQESFRTLQLLEAEKETENQLLQMSLAKKKQETEDMHALKSQREKLLFQLDSEYSSKKEQMAGLVHDEKKLAALVASLQKTDDNVTSEVLQNVEIPRNQRQQPQIEPEVSKIRPNAGSGGTISGKAFSELYGQLPLPVNGVIIEHFGRRRFETTWDGSVISAKEGAVIHAVAAGRVVFADWFRGYGLMLIVDHGKGYMSLYAYNQSLHKNVGDRVSAGDLLASVGRSGGHAQAALYFGIRKNGRPVNPEPWFRKAAKE